MRARPHDADVAGPCAGGIRFAPGVPRRGAGWPHPFPRPRGRAARQVFGVSPGPRDETGGERFAHVMVDSNGCRF
jgi:hypothetical protein